MPLLSNAVVASIGPITSATCARLGVRVDVEASPYTIPALVDALERHLRLASSTASR
jgi:uroporphyrinogen-III synthase